MNNVGTDFIFCVLAIICFVIDFTGLAKYRFQSLGFAFLTLAHIT